MLLTAHFENYLKMILSEVRAQEDRAFCFLFPTWKMKPGQVSCFSEIAGGASVLAHAGDGVAWVAGREERGSVRKRHEDATERGPYY